MSRNTSNTQKFVNVTEVASEPLHVPIVVGNEHFIVTQVDYRRIEDTRHITFNKILETGELLPLHNLDENFQQNLLNTCRLVQKVLPSACFSDSHLNEFLRKLVQKEIVVQQQLQHQQLQALSQKYTTDQPRAQPLLFNQNQGTQSMEADRNVANITQQLQWNNRYDSKQFPLHNSQGTSTTELGTHLRRRSKSATPHRVASFMRDNFAFADVARLRTHGTNTVEIGVGGDSLMRTETAPTSMSTQTASTSSTQTVPSGTMLKGQERTTQTNAPTHQSVGAQTHNVKMEQQQTSTHNMDVLMGRVAAPQQVQYKVTAATPMAVPMSSNSESKELPLGIPVSVVHQKN